MESTCEPSRAVVRNLSNPAGVAVKAADSSVRPFSGPPWPSKSSPSLLKMIRRFRCAIFLRCVHNSVSVRSCSVAWADPGGNMRCAVSRTPQAVRKGLEGDLMCFIDVYPFQKIARVMPRSTTNTHRLGILVTTKCVYHSTICGKNPAGFSGR